jgi:tetrahydromethanopterin S-methyltransferase subunit G
LTPRQSSKPTGNETTPPPQEGTPKIETAVQGHNFGTQFAFDVNKQIGKLEVCMVHVEERLEKVEGKLELVHLDVSGAKKIAWAFGIILSIVGAVGLVLLNKILDLVVAHYTPK